MKIVFFGTSNIALPVLEALRNGHEIVGVVTTPDAKVGRKQSLQESPVSALAVDLKLPLFKPESLKNNQEFLEQLKKLGADIFVVVAYGKILPQDFLTLPPQRTINMHPSLLPKYRGPSPIRTALLNGDQETGVSIILLDEQTDHGPIIVQNKLKIEPDDNDFTLTDKLGKAAANLIFEAIEGYTTGKLNPIPQDDSQATFTKLITKEDGKINWEQPAEQIYNQFRAFYPWPGIWATWNGKILKITDCKATELQKEHTTENYREGQVLKSGIVVCGGDTYLKINSLQLEGKNETSITDFLNGYNNFVGSKLE